MTDTPSEIIQSVASFKVPCEIGRAMYRDTLGAMSMTDSATAVP